MLPFVTCKHFLKDLFSVLFGGILCRFFLGLLWKGVSSSLVVLRREFWDQLEIKKVNNLILKCMQLNFWFFLKF